MLQVDEMSLILLSSSWSHLNWQKWSKSPVFGWLDWQGDILQQLLRTLIQCNTSPLDLLEEMACTVLPQVWQLHSNLLIIVTYALCLTLSAQRWITSKRAIEVPQFVRGQMLEILSFSYEELCRSSWSPKSKLWTSQQNYGIGFIKVISSNASWSQVPVKGGKGLECYPALCPSTFVIWYRVQVTWLFESIWFKRKQSFSVDFVLIS